MTHEARRVSVVGGGTMGVSIAYVFAMAGFDTILVEPDAGRAAAALGTMREAAAGAVARGKADAEAAEARLGAVRVERWALALPEGRALAIETVPVRRGVKLEVLGEIAARGPRLIATNTSALGVSDIADAVGDPSRFLGMHFFNPVWSLMLVKVVRGRATSDAAVAEVRAYAAVIGKAAAVVNDSPGFATSRLDLALALGAIRMVEDGVASAEDIDRAATTAYRHPMGPLRLPDVVGLDVRLDIARHLGRALGPHFAPPRLLEEMVARGDLRRKSGRGFHDWSAGAAGAA